MKKDRACGASPFPVYPANPMMMNQMPMPGMIMPMPGMGMGMPMQNMPNQAMGPGSGCQTGSTNQNMQQDSALEQQVTSLRQQVNSLERRVSQLENVVGQGSNSGSSSNYNNSNYQML